ncbi:MAG: hypothetical protein AAF799_17835 [Myxococcota bacterium]
MGSYPSLPCVHPVGLALVVAGLGACGPSVDASDQPSGVLEYETLYVEFYRDGHRIEGVPGHLYDERFYSDRIGCRVLTDWAVDTLEGTIAGLDPSRDYDFGIDGEDCGWTHSPSGEVHLPDFERSPFSCDSMCCQRDLSPIGLVYLYIFSNYAGETIHVVGEDEPKVALEPDESCM